MFVDDPDKDYRKRYAVPEHWILDAYSHFGIDYYAYVDKVLSMLPEAPGRVLDAGCGDGFVAGKLVGKGYEVWGIDYSPMAIAFAKILAAKGNFYQVDLREFPALRRFGIEFFDIALLIETIEHIAPEFHQLVLKNLSAVLKPGGLLVVTAPSTNAKPHKWHYKHFTIGEVATLLGSCGFSIRQVLGQSRRSILFSSILWRLISNQFYDLIFLRKMLSAYFRRYLNIATDLDEARRYIIAAQRD